MMSPACRPSSTSGPRSMPRRPRSTTPRRFAELPAEKQVSARGIEVGHIFYFGTKYSEPMKAVVAGPDGAERPVHMGSYGIGPSRAGRRDHRGVPRRRRHQVAGGGGAVQGRDPQSQAGRRRHRCGLRAALPRAHRQGRRGALRRPRPAAGSEVRHCRPHRHSLADPGRAERACRGQGRGQEARPTAAAS